jgi:hypothetical protein
VPFAAPRTPAVEPMLMILPRFRSIKCFAASRDISIIPMTFV